jgi:DNA-binding transcriptional MocR family regulator
MQNVSGSLPHCPEGRYTKLPDALLSELTPREHQLVHALLSYRWTDDSAIYPSVRTLATRLRCTDRTIQRTLRSLERQGYLVTVARYREGDHGQTSNRYAPGPMLLPLLPPADTVRRRPRRHAWRANENPGEIHEENEWYRP